MTDLRTAIIVVTYKRTELLAVLFDSFRALTMKPAQIYVVDNDKDPVVGELCSVLQDDLNLPVSWIPMEENTGGSGGFCKGVEQAYTDGHEWLWLMDDDVKVMPTSLAELQPWLNVGVQKNWRVFQPCRRNFNGEFFYWQYWFWNKLGIPNPIAPAEFKPGEKARRMNTACFEGGVFHRSIPEEIGAPDKRFFIYWDDTIYGYLASKITQPVLLPNIMLQRTRELPHFRVGGIRKLNSTGDMARYHILRNRGYMAHYLKQHGDFNPLLFGIGTFATIAKELIRLFVTKSFREGAKAIFKGARDAVPLRRDKSWQPMPPLGQGSE
jgi:glycosyltransferase involved in cell wall biosynthesis